MALALLIAWPTASLADRGADLDAALTACAAIQNTNIRSACLEAIIDEFGYRNTDAAPSPEILAPAAPMDGPGGDPAVEAVGNEAAIPPSPAQEPLIEDAVIPGSDSPLPSDPVLDVDDEAAADAEGTVESAPAEVDLSPEPAPRKPVRMIDLRAAPFGAAGAQPAGEAPPEPASGDGGPVRAPVPRPDVDGTPAAMEDGDDGSETDLAPPPRRVPVPAPVR